MKISSLLKQSVPELDPHTTQPISIISHAHSDHISFNVEGKKRIIICSKETAALLQYRLKENNLHTIFLDYAKEYSFTEVLQEVDKEVQIEHPYDFQDLCITLYPAGHILGSSQILIRNNHTSVLYSGDFKLHSGLTCPPLVFPPKEQHIDYLLMESTFGKSKYIFPDINIIRQRVIEFCNNALENNCIPILLGYSLGKSQEITKLLKDSGFNIYVHGSTYNINRIYEQLDTHLGSYHAYSKALFNSSILQQKPVLIIPPQYAKSRMVTNIPNRKVAVFSGWAVDKSAQYFHKADEGFPLSDHADFNELVEYATRINPTKVLTLHGFALDLARELNKQGLDAQPYQPDGQYGLF